MAQEGRARQKSSNLDTLYSDGAEAQRELRGTLSDVAASVGGSVDMPDELKDRGKAERNIAKRYQGDPAGLTDISRGSIVVDTPEQMRMAHEELAKRANVVCFDDRVSNPQSGSGYRDLQYGVEASNGHVSEVQVHIRPLWQAKNGRGHEIYTELGGMYDRAEAAGRTELFDEDKPARNKLFKEMKGLYKGAMKDAGVDFSGWQPLEDPVAARREYATGAPVVVSGERVSGWRQARNDDEPAVAMPAGPAMAKLG